MDIQITEKKDNELEFKIKGEDHTLSNLLLKFLEEMEEVEIAQYDIEHPQIGEPDFYVRTKGKDPVEIVKKAAEEAEKRMKKLKKQIPA